MQVDYAILADAAATESGKHYILGGGWDTIYAASFPITHPMMALAIRLRVPWLETNEEHEVMIDLLDGDGNSVLPGSPPGGKLITGRPPQLSPGADQVIQLVFAITGTTFAKRGDYAVVVRIDGLDASRTTFHVVAIQ